MRRGTCVKCGAATVRAAQNAIAFGEHLPVQLRPHREPGARGMFRNHSTEGIWAFACTSCGYLELQVLEPAALAFIAEQWVPVQPTR